jgi:CRP-like cAMP-binding protein
MSKLTMDRVRGLELFSECRRAELKAIDRLACTLDVPEDTYLCREGERGKQFFVLVAGTATLNAPTGASAILHGGAWFGEIALMRDAYRQATVKTRTAATVMVFNRREFAALLEIGPGIRSRLERSVDLVERSDRPTLQSWYEPIRSGRDEWAAFSF